MKQRLIREPYEYGVVRGLFLSGCAFALNNRRNSLGKNFQVEPEGPFIHVLKV